MMRKIIKLLSTLKLTVSILIILALTSIVGTLIQQQQNPFIYIKRFGDPLYRILSVFGFFYLYHSWWYISLLIILALNLIVCSIRRLPRDIKIIASPKIKLDEKALSSLTSREKIMLTAGPVDQTLEHALSAIRKGGFPCKEKVGDGEKWHLFSEKGKYGRLAFYITHLSIILIFLGAIIGAVQGFKGFVNIPEGEKVDFILLNSQDGRGLPRKLGFEVECEKFEVTYYQDEHGNITHRPKDYKSKLVVYEGGERVRAKEIEVNDPLNYKGIFFYQSSFGEIPKITIAVKDRNGGLVGHYQVGENESFHFMDSNHEDTEVRLVQYLPDFAMGPNRQFTTRSNIPNNPAALLEVRKDGGQVSQAWVFQMFPDFPHKKSGDYSYSLASVNAAKRYTGLQVVRDPGVPIVWAGCIILVVGIIVMFSVPHQRIWVTITRQGQHQKIEVAGTTNKNKPSFQNTFAKFVTIVKENLADTKR
ncbi:MAG: cytochrome c biogenesis protein ResB [bacterium]